MTKSLLVITLVLVIILMLIPILITFLISKESKERGLFNKIIKGIVIADILFLIILFSLWVTPIKNNELYFKEEEKVEIEPTSLSEAGFNELSMEEYLNLIKAPEKSIILVARPTCGYCEQFAPILKKAKDDMNLTVNYINTDSFTQEDYETFNNSLDYLKNENWGTPLTLIVQNGEVVADNSGYVDLETIKEFFKNNGFGE